jgi:23S rRNA (cytidine1920-2'-O)/16S rRNA (cytidine1409-2'-O)-methyltransferase
MVRRGLVSTRVEARDAVEAGWVTVAGARATKPTSMVRTDEPVEVREPERRFVSRGGEKLAAALDRFAIDPADQHCLDVGASTGGFTDCLLQAAARSVVAVDVGYGQLAWSLRSDPRVTVLDRTNVRDLDREDLPAVPSLLVADLSFISLRTVARDLRRIGADDATSVVLVKPQFETDAASVPRGGVVRDPETWRTSIAGVIGSFAEVGIGARAVMASPISGRSGNVEFLLQGRAGEAVSLDDTDVDHAIAIGEEVSR